MKLTVWRNGVAIHSSEGYIPPGLLSPGDTVHLSTGIWKTEDLNWIPVEVPNVTVTSRDPANISPEELLANTLRALKDQKNIEES